MIPLKLVLKNFLSYREATLDFRGLHTACICGANGAGKSSLLEAIAWAVWGQSRAAAEDDVIHIGTQEAQVDFIFSNNQQTYRILRSRYRGQASSLEFQVAQGGQKAEGRRQKAEGAEEAREAGAAEGQGSRGAGRVPDPHSPLPTSHSLLFRTLTAKGVRATQQLILEHLKLDYETFVNSAYLRQGRADEFMLKRPTERKQILADLLKLDQYDRVAEQSKDQSRQFKGQIELLERSLETIQAQLQERDRVVAEQAALEAVLARMQHEQTAVSEQLQTLQTQQQQRHTWQQQLTWQQQQQRHLEQDCQRLQQELAVAQQQQQELGALLQQEEAIAAGYRQFQTLQAQEETASARFKAHQLAQAQRQHYQQQQNEPLAEQQRHWQHVQAQLEALMQQDAELQQTLTKATDVETAVQQLQQARTHLSQLDQRQVQASPLLQRRQVIQSQLDRLSDRLNARLEELHASAQQLQAQQSCQPQLKQAVLEVSDRITALDARRAYQEQVRERGLERRSFMEQLQEQQRHCETQLAALEQKMQLLAAEDSGQRSAVSGQEAEGRRQEAEGKRQTANGKRQEHEFAPTAEPDSAAPLKTQNSKLKTQNSKPKPSHPHTLTPSHPSPLTPHFSPLYPPCPLCDRPLDEQHWQLVLMKHQTEQQAVLDQIWVIREQLSASEREIQILRDEYRAVERELKPYNAAVERRGQLQEQLQMTVTVQASLQQVLAEIAELERSLQLGNYATELQDELRLLDRSLQQLNYDEKDHALARGEVDRWRWADIRHAEIKQAQRRHDQLMQRQPDLQAQSAQLQAHLEQLQTETATQLAVYDRHLADIGYALEQHNALRQALRQAQSWQLRYQEIDRARQHYPQMQQRVSTLTQTLGDHQQTLQTAQTQVQQLIQQLERTPDRQAHIQTLEAEMQQQRSHLDQQLAALGRLQQQQQHLETLNTQHSTLKIQLQAAQRQQRIYQELAQAFGKNGIQALMIENALPQLEAESNQILSRLSANQLHIQFVTQRSNRRDQARSAKASKAAPYALQPAKLIETLDILIADAHGTRPYETYSGGEAFRVNFAIRLALARLLAHRSGTALQMLIIDEGFGTQDAEGCDRLIAAINAIAPDFACILTITHVPHFKEAFQSRVEVYKTEQGSQVSLVI